MNPAARSARQRAYRARKHEGRITLPVEVDEAALAVALVDAGLLSVDKQDDPRTRYQQHRSPPPTS